ELRAGAEAVPSDRLADPVAPLVRTEVDAFVAPVRLTVPLAPLEDHLGTGCGSRAHAFTLCTGSDNYSGKVSRSLIVQTREIDPVEDLLAYADPSAPLAWLRRGDGIVAVGDATPTSIRIPAGAASVRSRSMADAW